MHRGMQGAQRCIQECVEVSCTQILNDFFYKFRDQHMSVLLIGKVEISEEYLTFEVILYQIYGNTTCMRSFLQFLRKDIAIKLLNKQLISV